MPSVFYEIFIYLHFGKRMMITWLWWWWWWWWQFESPSDGRRQPPRRLSADVVDDGWGTDSRGQSWRRRRCTGQSIVWLQSTGARRTLLYSRSQLNCLQPCAAINLGHGDISPQSVGPWAGASM